MSKRDDRVHDAEPEDELESYIAEEKRNPAFRTAYEDVEERHSIIDRLVGLRRRRRLSQSVVAERMGVGQSTVSGFETEDSDPRLSTLQRYARAVEAKLRLVVVVPDKVDWIECSGKAYRDGKSLGSSDVNIRQSDLAEEWYAEKRQNREDRWATPA